MKRFFKTIMLSIASAFTLVGLSSCKSDELTTIRIIGEWEVLSITIEDEPQDLSGAMKYTRFDADGTYWIINSENESYTKVGTWTIDDRVLTMTPDNDYTMTATYKIEGILAGVMVLKTESLDITITLKRVQSE